MPIPKTDYRQNPTYQPGYKPKSIRKIVTWSVGDILARTERSKPRACRHLDEISFVRH